MKNFYTLLLSGLLFCLAGNLSGQMFTVGLTDAEGDVGDEVCIDLVGANFVDVVGMQFTMLFDTSALEFVSASGSISGTTVSIINPSFFPTEIRLSYSPFSASGYTDAGPFTFGTICFRIKRGISTVVTIDPDPDLFEYTITEDGSSETFGPDAAVITNGTITGSGGTGATCSDGIQNGDETGVDCGGSCDPCMAMPTCTDGIQNGDETGVDCGGSCAPCAGTSMFTVDLTDAEGNVGDEVCIDLVGSNFTDVVGMQFTMLFDTSALEFVSATGSINGTTVSIINPTFFPTEIRLSYSPFSATGYTDAGPFTFGTICFRIKRNITTVVTIDPDPDIFEYTVTVDGGSETFGPGDATISNGTITGGSGSGATCSDGIQNGDETGVDCGGSCAACPPDPTCTDGIQNGDETGVDCGGSCTPCTTMPTCGVGSSTFHLCAEEVCDIAVGSQACIDLSVANFTDITAVQIDLLYPGNNLDYVSTTAHPAIGTSLTANAQSDGQVRLLFFRSADAPVSLNDGEVFATVCFTNETAAATTVTLDRPRITSSTSDDLPSVLNNGSVNNCGNTTPTCTDGIQNGDETGIDCGGSCTECPTSTSECGEGSDRFNLCVSDACDIAVGAEACIDLSVSMFTNITGFQAKLLYPGANLDFTGFNSVHPTLGDGLQINEIGTDGEIRLFFFRSADMPVSIADGESIITICFTNQTASTTIIDATDLVVTDVDGDVIGPIANDGMVNGCSTMGETCSDGIMNNGETGVDCGGPNCAACPTSTTCGEGTTDVDFCVGSVCGDAGTEVCVPVHIGNFNSLGGLQFSLAFTAANLDYTRFIPSPNLAGITVQPPNDSDGNPIDGIVNFIWADLSGVGVTFPDDEAIVELCFTVENASVTPISFRDPATELRAVDVEGTRLPFRLNPGAVNQNCGGMETCSDGIQNNGETGVDCGGPNCTACPTMGTCNDGILNNGETEIDCGGPNCAPCMSTCGEDTDLLSVCLGQACDVAVGSQACIELFVGNFDDITGFQFRIFYPGANLDYASFTSNPALGDPLQVNEFNDGQVRVFFFDSDQGGVTLADGESLGTVCFTNEFDGRTELDGQNMVATNTTGDVIGPIINDGFINGCTSMPSCTNGIKDGDEEGVDCGGSCPDVCETCSDGIMNGDETGVDCGGSCGPCPTGTVTFTAGSGTAQIGQQVCVNVTVADFADISTLGLTLGYNSTSLSLASVTANSVLPGFGPANFTTTTAGQIVVSYTPASPQTLANGEDLFEVCFNVTGADESPLTITNATAMNGAGTALTVNTNNGIINAGGVVEYDELSLVGDNVTGAMGTEVCVDVRVFNLENLAGFQFGIDFDETKLEFTRAVSTEELPGLQVAEVGGFLRVVWFDPNVGSNSVDDGLSIVAVCFNVLEACETTIEFADQPPGFRIRATTPEDDLVPVDLFHGSVNAGVSCGPIDTPPNLVLDLGSVSGPVGTEVCVDLNVTNFTSLTRLAFTVDHDPTKVTFSRALNFGFPALTGANVGAPALGQVVLDWTSSVSTGQSLPAGARLVTLCYFVERLEVTPLNFSNSNITIQARNANNQNVGVIPSNGAINPDAPTVDGLTFQIGSTSADVNEEICLPVVGFQAIDMVGFQYTINYDPAKLEYIGTGPDYAFDGFNNGAVNNSQPGVLAVVWTSPSAVPQTLEDGRALFSICFRVLSDDLTLVTFGERPTAIEFENEDGIIDATLLNGQVNGSPAPTIVDADIRSPRCEDGSDGSIALTVSGGSNLTYQWSPNVSSGAAATGLPAGTYSVTVTNPGTTQSTTNTYTVGPGTPFDIEVAEVSGISCNGARDGRILIATIGPDTGPYIFDWSGTLPDDGPEQINLDAGAYAVIVTNANGCMRTLSNIQIGEPGVLAIAGSGNDILPGGTGGVTIQINGGSRPFNYSWTGPGGYASDQEDIDDVTEPGTYCLTVTDNNNCTTTQCFAVINALAVVSTSINVGCADDNSNCSIDIEVVGGNGTYDYEWTFDGTVISGDQDLVLADCQYGDYTLRVTSGANIITQIVTLEEPTAIVVEATITPATAGNNGSIGLLPSGGSSPYTFDWGGGITDQNRDNLTAGEYCVTVTDDNSCTTDTCFTVGSSAVAILEVLTTPPSCPESEDGNIQIALDAGVAPVNVRIVPLDIDSNYTTTTVNIPVPTGSWRVFLTDAQGARVDTMITVTGPEAISISSSTVTSDTEDTGCSGMISLDIAGGTGATTVVWSNGDSGATISSLCAGDYTPTITDANGCTFTGEAITVGRIDEELESITDVACADGTEGGVDVTVTGGAMPYTFAWRRAGGTDILADTEDISGQTAGDYTLTITDATGATLVKNYTIGISAGFNVTTEVTSDYNGFGVSCIGATDGRIVITISGQGSFMYEFLLDGAMVGIDSVLENAAAGLYTVSVIDDGGCEVTRMVEVTAPPALLPNATITNISCGSTGDGSIALAPTGGVPSYSFLWSNGSEASRITGLSTGDYTVTVTDDNGCTTVESYTLNGPEDLAITLEAVEATDGCNGSIRILPLGGSGNYRYTWPQLPNQGDNPFAEGLCPGVYTIEVTDDNECQTVTMTATVLDRSLPCLDVRKVITPDGDGLNEKFVIFCSDGDEAINNNLQIFNRWGQLVYKADDYDCTDLGGINCFEGETNDGAILPEGPYYYIFEFTSLGGEQMQQRGSLTILRD